MNTIENHLLHLNRGPGANGDSRRRPRGKRGSPISPGLSSTDNARILWQFHEKIGLFLLGLFEEDLGGTPPKRRCYNLRGFPKNDLNTC